MNKSNGCNISEIYLSSNSTNNLKLRTDALNIRHSTLRVKNVCISSPEYLAYGQGSINCLVNAAAIYWVEYELTVPYNSECENEILLFYVI